MIAQEKARDVAEMEMTWSDKVERQATLHEGRRLLRRMLEARFGPLSEDARRRIESLASSDEVERVFDQALEADSLGQVLFGE